MMRTSVSVQTLALLLGGSIGLACWHEDSEHCSYNDGNSSCRTRGLGQFCSQCEASNHGCIDFMPSEDCMASPPDEQAPTGAEPVGDDGPQDGTTGPGVASECAVNADCPGATPICDLAGGQCVSCDAMAQPDEACAGLSAVTPVCGSGGVCVACEGDEAGACGGTTPVCAGNVCVRCTAHDQCGGAACNFFTGACLAADAVVEVWPAESIDLSMAVASLGDEGTVIMHPGVYDAELVVDESRVIAFIGAPDEMGDVPVWEDQPLTVAPQLSVSEGGVVILDGIVLSGNHSVSVPALGSSSGRVWADRSRIVGNYGGGIHAVDGSELVVRNCFVGNNGSEGSTTSGVIVTDGTLSMVYTTVAANLGTPGSQSIACIETTGEVRNSIVAAEGNESIDCAGVIFGFNVVDSMTYDGTNNAVAEFASMAFVAPAVHDFHIGPGEPFEGVGRWQGGNPLDDPRIDIDGEPRLAVEGVPDYVGADLP